MRIPSATLQLGPTPYGERSIANHSQFGTVELVSDGRIDDSFRAREGSGDASQWRDLTGPALGQLLSTEARLASTSLEGARQAFESGQQLDDYAVGEEHSRVLSGSLRENGLTGYAFPHTDWRGVLTRCSVHLNDAQHRYQQGVAIENTPDGAVATLTSQRADGTHVLTVPVSPEGTVELDKSTETLTLRTPWLDGATQHLGKEAISQLSDPRLERVAEAAELGYHLASGELGAGWESSAVGPVQTWTTENQKLVIDTREHNFVISAHSWGTGHAGSGDDVGTDYEINRAVKWQGGRFERLPA